ncbi:dopamine beta-monooxygenase, putative [Ricinus communis]|uniref:Dopamine beta-monooxygenase, putative n=1 Tax=Ricinus communis TaxID=3988 RepID=B9RNX5_RICCO|nr:dopamine beta-monooxygenase, putative [Ricinus communis]
MVQHQLRGVINIIDDCSFKISRFDMLSGTDVHWWGAISTDFANLTNGFIISDHKLNQTYENASFIVQLNKTLTWDQIQYLSVWDLPTASDFGHVILTNESFSGPTVSPGVAPSPLNNDTDIEKGDSWSFKVPTMFDNCKVLSKEYRIRWSLSKDNDFIDIGLEATTGVQNYMAFGWAKPGSDLELMIGADVAVVGFKEDGKPFADDFYITRYSECTINQDGSAFGVCPDTIFEGSDPIGLVNNTKLIYGHRKDGVSFIRYRRPLVSIDKKYDVAVDYTANLTVIWALGLMRPPDTLRPYYLPQYHGAQSLVNYGHFAFNVSEHVNDCVGPLDAQDKEDFSVQAGHDVALYITSDLMGGNATVRNKTEIIYAGGPEAEGVLASPTELIWQPGRNTPDQVYYQSLYQPKMGWKVQVVDGGLSDMYNNNVLLDDQQVTFFWTLAKDSISIAARGEKKSGYIAIGFGSGMMYSYAYVGWVDESGKGNVNSYWIDGKDASSIHPTNENLTDVRCKSENGIITFEFTRPLKPSCSHRDLPECKNIIDSTSPLKVIWAMGAKWSDEHLTDGNMHSVTSHRPVRVLLMSGSAEAEQDLRPVLAVHGFMMFLAWGILLPGGILAARYLKHVKGDGWYQVHVYLQYSGLAIVLLGLLFAVAELRGFYVSSLHVKFGLTAIFLACVQPVNAYMRPKKPVNGEEVSSKRLVWEYFHIIVGRCAIIAGVASLFTGIKHLKDRYGSENLHGYNWALIVWLSVGVLIVMYLEYREKQRRRDRTFGRSNWVLGNFEEEDSIDLLSPSRAAAQRELQQAGRMEVQLEALNR